MEKKEAFLRLIKSNIENYKYHYTIVNSSSAPRYAYTIGLSDLFDFELIFAGGINYLKDDLSLILDTIVEELNNDKSISNRNITVGSLGTFSLCTVDPSWSKLMMLGVFDYYKTDHITALQIIPDFGHRTLDVPDMSKEFNVSSEPIWQWLIRKWDYTVPEDATVVTNIKALVGEPITEAMRWEDDAWEMFAGDGSEVQKDDARVVSLATILGIDSTLLPIIDLEVGKGLWRDSVESDWNNWDDLVERSVPFWCIFDRHESEELQLEHHKNNQGALVQTRVGPHRLEAVTECSCFFVFRVILSWKGCCNGTLH